MAGTLTISTLSDGTNSTSSTNCIQGSAKAWVNFNGTTSPGTIRASYNVSSVTHTGTGQYTVTMTNAMTDANYATMLNFQGNLQSNVMIQSDGGRVSAPSQTTTTFTIALSSGSANYDSTVVMASVFR